MRGSRRGWQRVRTPPPLRNYKTIGSLSNIGPDPLINHKATKPAVNVGQSSTRQRNAILKVTIPHKLNKNVVKVGPPLAKPSGSAPAMFENVGELTDDERMGRSADDMTMGSLNKQIAKRKASQCCYTDEYDMETSQRRDHIHCTHSLGHHYRSYVTPTHSANRTA